MSHSATQRRPNILLITTDQQRADTIAALGLNPVIRTPTLDRLVAEGTSFTRAYTPSPVCVPARFALITGLPPVVSGCRENSNMPEGRRSLMEMLTAEGYATHGCGKMHFTPDPGGRRLWGFASRDFSEEVALGDDYHEHIRRHGYGHVLDLHGLRGEYYYVPQPSQLPAHLHHSTWVADRSIDFIKRQLSGKPFFLWTSFIKPHPPFENPSPWNRLYRSVDMPDPWNPRNAADFTGFWNALQNRYKYMERESNPHALRTVQAAYYACISFVDREIGRLLVALGPEIENTLVIFTSDHGELLGDYGCFGKRCMLEASARVPLVVRYPRAFPAGLGCDTAASLIDIFPTLQAAVGSTEPRPSEYGGDLSRLTGDRVGERRVFSQLSQQSLGLYMITDGCTKYVYSAADQKEWSFTVGDGVREQIAPLEESADLKAELLGVVGAHSSFGEVVDGAWRRHGRSRIPPDTREGVLFQDPPELYAALELLPEYGEARRQTVPSVLEKANSRAMDVNGLTRFNENWQEEIRPSELDASTVKAP
jgi:arylsulfatase A-like enzyme